MPTQIGAASYPRDFLNPTSCVPFINPNRDDLRGTTKVAASSSSVAHCRFGGPGLPLGLVLLLRPVICCILYLGLKLGLGL